MSFDHELLRRYGPVLPHVDAIPRTVTELYSRWSKFPMDKSLGRRRRNERRWLATYLEIASKEGEVNRGIQCEAGITWVGFWRRPVATDDAEAHQPCRAGNGAEGRRHAAQ